VGDLSSEEGEGEVNEGDWQRRRRRDRKLGARVET